MPRNGYVRQRGGRHWRFEERRNRWLLQCRGVCARYMSKAQFATTNGVSHLKCKLCERQDKLTPNSNATQLLLYSQPSPVKPSPVEGLYTVIHQKRAELADWRTQCLSKKGKLLCRTCATYWTSSEFEHPQHKSEFYRECSRCRQSWIGEMLQPVEKLAPLDRAYRELYPQLVEYGQNVTGIEITSNSLLYPGLTYFHLNVEQRSKAVERALEILGVTSSTAAA